nr:reverse transcriptase domain-containing protein [Tanacetum cinerariifolium]
AAHRWLKKEPSRSITTWEDLVSKFINEFFPPSRTTSLRNEILNFEQKFGESFHEAWDRYKDLLRACPHHGFTELHQLNTFYNALNHTDQDSLNAAACGNLLERSTQEVLTIIENKSKVRNSRSKSIASQVKAYDTNSSYEIAKLTHAVNEQTSAMTTAMTAMLRQFQATLPPAPVKAVEETCVTCGEGCNLLSEIFPDIDAFNNIHPHFDDDPLSGSTTYSANSLLEEFTDELALITYPPDYDDNLQFDIESDLKEIEFLLYQENDSYANNFYDDPFNSEGEKIKESKLLMNELDLPCNSLPYSKTDSFNSQDFSRVDDPPSPDNEDKVFNPGIIFHEKSVTIITRVAHEKKLAISYASLVFKDFEPPFCAPLFFKDVLWGKRVKHSDLKQALRGWHPMLIRSSSSL